MTGEPRLVPGEAGFVPGEPGLVTGEPGLVDGEPSPMDGEPGLRDGDPGFRDGGPRHLVIMGVSGVGKTTVARGVGEVTGLRFAEADEFHSEENVARMRAGIPLDDADRLPWLRELASWMADRHAEGVSTVLACSALKRSYRDVLRQGVPDVEFVHLDGAAELIRDRMTRRTGHYMSVSLLDSQRAALERLESDESGIVLDAARPAAELVAAVAATLRARAQENGARSGL